MASLSSVLIVDDEPAVRNVMARWVSALGLHARTAASAEEALVALEAQRCDLAVIDLMMPGRDGLWLAGELHRFHPQTAVVIATGYMDRIEGAKSDDSIADLLIKPVARDRFAQALDRGRQWREQVLEEIRWHAQLSVEVQQRTRQIRDFVERRALEGANEAEALISLAVERMPETMAHAERVGRYAQSVARQLRAAADLNGLLETGARLHDIGKAAMPQALLTKPSPLTAAERALMRRHVNVGAEITSATRTLADVAPIVLASHEWFNGGGYPLRLSGEAIPLASRIIAVADAYDAMTQDRSYRLRLRSSDAVAELVRGRGVQFDPVVLDAFTDLLARH
ncbi:MAG TPA: HD domain-containing phosphohydrolase [Vicinamibacterales bacterium]|nr:HD domain-containing phosphohydrolase [Vicinamibacterales bacterium]